MGRKLCVLVSLTTVTLLITLFGCSGNAEVSVNETDKFVGSRDTIGFSVDMPVYDNVQTFVDNAELIVVASIIGETIDDEREFLDKLYTASLSVMQVHEILKGDPSEEILFIQTGSHLSDDYETKIKPNKQYLLFLTPSDYYGQTVYWAIGCEQGIIEVDDKGSLMSYADFGISATFDYQMLNGLTDEIDHAVQFSEGSVKDFIENDSKIEEDGDDLTSEVKPEGEVSETLTSPEFVAEESDIME